MATSILHQGFDTATTASEYPVGSLKPKKFAAAVFGVTLAFTVLSANAVGLRAWIRFKRGQFAIDDYLMCTALVVNLVHNSMVMRGTFVGIGSADSQLSPELQSEGRKYLFLWQISYTISLLFIKTSLLATLKDMAKGKGMRYTCVIWGLIVLASMLSMAGLVTLLAKCSPIPSNWTGDGSCIESKVFVALAKTGYAFDVLSDIAITIIWTLLLWTPDMRFRSKALTGAVLCCGIIALVASVVRTTYTDAYSSDDNYLFNAGKIVLWTVIECGAGLMAGSLLMLGLLRQSHEAEKKWKELELQQSEADLTKMAPTHQRSPR